MPRPAISSPAIFNSKSSSNFSSSAIRANTRPRTWLHCIQHSSLPENLRQRRKLESRLLRVHSSERLGVSSVKLILTPRRSEEEKRFPIFRLTIERGFAECQTGRARVLFCQTEAHDMESAPSSFPLVFRRKSAGLIEAATTIRGFARTPSCWHKRCHSQRRDASERNHHHLSRHGSPFWCRPFSATNGGRT